MAPGFDVYIYGVVALPVIWCISQEYSSQLMKSTEYTRQTYQCILYTLILSKLTELYQNIIKLHTDQLHMYNPLHQHVTFR